jgi:DNA-binding transcriptional MerR regulator
MREEFIETVNEVARGARCDPSTVRVYADAGLVECRRLANGTRLFRRSASKEVAQILANRLAKRGWARA